LNSQIHKVRDGLTSLHVSTFLAECGYQFAGALLNIPSVLQSRPVLRESAFQPSADDLIWISTRLPLHETAKTATTGQKRRLRIIDRSESPLENRILSSFEPYFETCCRTRISLSQSVPLAKEAHTYRICDFQEFSGGILTQHGAIETRLRPPQADRLAIGYLFSLPPQEGLGRLIAAFSTGGTETLIFGQLLSTAFRERVKTILRTGEARLLIARFSVPEYVPTPLLAFPRHELAAKLIADQPLVLEPAAIPLSV